MTLLIHRVKTDLTVDHASSFRLAAIKHLLQAIRSRRDQGCWSSIGQS